MTAFQFVAGHPALDLVNTLDDRFLPDPHKELLNSYADLLRFTTAAGLLTAKEARLLDLRTTENEKAKALLAARNFRETLASVLYSILDHTKPPSANVAALEKEFKRAAAHRVLSWSTAGATWTWPETPRDAAKPIWLLANAAGELLVSDSMARLRGCDEQSCRWLFLDTSKNRKRRWCDMKVCGNRVKARRYQANRETASTP